MVCTFTIKQEAQNFFISYDMLTICAKRMWDYLSLEIQMCNHIIVGITTAVDGIKIQMLSKIFNVYKLLTEMQNPYGKILWQVFCEWW